MLGGLIMVAFLWIVMLLIIDGDLRMADFLAVWMFYLSWNS